jgi:hypothetical protein
MSTEAAYLQAIQRALDRHEQLCGDEPTAILLSPADHSRLDWPDYRGIVVEPDEDVLQGRIRIACASSIAALTADYDDSWHRLERKLEALGDLFDSWHKANDPDRREERKDRETLDRLWRENDERLAEPNRDFDELYRRLLPDMPKIYDQQARSTGTSPGERVLKSWNTGVTAAAIGYEPAEPSPGRRLMRALRRLCRGLIAAMTARRRGYPR